MNWWAVLGAFVMGALLWVWGFHTGWESCAKVYIEKWMNSREAERKTDQPTVTR